MRRELGDPHAQAIAQRDEVAFAQHAAVGDPGAFIGDGLHAMGMDEEQAGLMAGALGGVIAAGVNVLGAVGTLAYEYGVTHKRNAAGPALTPGNAQAELARLQAHPDRYLADNYDTATAGLCLAPLPPTIDGHLRAMAFLDEPIPIHSALNNTHWPQDS